MDSSKDSVTENFRRRQMWALSPEERLERAEKLNQHAMELLRANPPAYQAYLKRQYRLRRQVPSHSSDE